MHTTYDIGRKFSSIKFPEAFRHSILMQWEYFVWSVCTHSCFQLWIPCNSQVLRISSLALLTSKSTIQPLAVLDAREVFTAILGLGASSISARSSSISQFQSGPPILAFHQTIFAAEEQCIGRVVSGKSAATSWLPRIIPSKLLMWYSPPSTLLLIRAHFSVCEIGICMRRCPDTLYAEIASQCIQYHHLHFALAQCHYHPLPPIYSLFNVTAACEDKQAYC